MPAGESARSPIDADDAACHNESGDEGARKRSASPATANQSTWDNPAKKLCTEGIDLWVQSTSEAIAIPDVSSQYQENHETLINMGFNSDEIDVALRMSSNDVEKAVQYLTREIVGLDATNKPASGSGEKLQKGGFGLPELLRNTNPSYVESDDEELAEEDKYNWSDEVFLRIRVILEHNSRYVIFRKNGTFHRRLQVAYNILQLKDHPKRAEVLGFVDEFIAFMIGRHVNCSDVRPGFDLLRQLLELQPPYIGKPEAIAIQDLFFAITPLLVFRLTLHPTSVKTVLAIDEMFNFRNKFFVQGAQHIDLPNRVYPPLKLMSIELLERYDHKHLYCYLADNFVQHFLPILDKCLEYNNDEELFNITLLDLQCLFRTLNIFSNFIDRNNDLFLTQAETWVTKALDRFRIVTDKEIRDAHIRRQGLDLLQEVVFLCERFDMDVPMTTQRARLDYLRKWIKCPQMESILHALEELGTIADRFHRNGILSLSRPKSYVNEDFFKQWLEENKVLQIVLTGNMDHVVYVERIQPILQYMTPELTFDDMKFVWSLRKGRMGVSGDNFNKIMEFISKSVNDEQIEWLIELFKKSFRSRESRLAEPIFNFCAQIANQKDRDDEFKLRITNVIWELIHIARGPPKGVSFKSIEYGIKKHCDLLNSMHDKTEKDRFVDNRMEDLKSNETFNEVTLEYLSYMLDKTKRLHISKFELLAAEEQLRLTLKEKRLFDPILDRLEHIRQLAHERFDAAQNMNTDSQSNAVFESTSDMFGGNSDNILATTIFGCTDYAFILRHSLRFLKFLHDLDASVVDVEYVQRLFSIFIERPDATSAEMTEIFQFLFDIKLMLVKAEVSREIVTHMCRMDMCTMQITGLKCFCRYWEELPILSNEKDPLESFIFKDDIRFQKDCECKLFVWKLILFNQNEDVVEKCMQTFCQRDLVLIDEPSAVVNHNYSFMAVFSHYVEQLKGELYKRMNKPNTPITYDTKNLKLTDEEIRNHNVQLDGILSETIIHAINRLLRFMHRWVLLGNEKNHMMRRNPSHGSSVPGHSVTYDIELRNEDDDIDCDIFSWKRIVCDSSTTIGEFKVRLAHRLLFHEGVKFFTIHKRDEDMALFDANLRYDFLTLQDVKLCSVTDSLFLSEKLRLLIKPRKTPPVTLKKDEEEKKRDKERAKAKEKEEETARGHGKKNSQDKEKVEWALREDCLPVSLFSACNFYELLHELASIGDQHIRDSVRHLLLLIPTQPSLLNKLSKCDNVIKDEDDDKPLSARVLKMYDDYIVLSEPGRMLYGLEAMCSLVSPTRLTVLANQDAKELIEVFLQVGIVQKLTKDVLGNPHLIPKSKCSDTDRHAIFERVIQILRSCLTVSNTYLKSARNEQRIRDEMLRTCERMKQSRQVPRSVDPELQYILLKQDIKPPEDLNLPCARLMTATLCNYTVFRKLESIIEEALSLWKLDDLIAFFENIRNFQWIHMATDDRKNMNDPFFYFKDEKGVVHLNTERASKAIRGKAGEMWGDECRLIIVKKAFSLMRHMTRSWMNRHNLFAQLLLDSTFLKPCWVSFYQDVLVNSLQEAYRKYGQGHIVKVSKRCFQITMASLKMILEMFMALPFHDGHTCQMNELEQRQRQHCDVLVQTVCEIFHNDGPRRANGDEEIDWDHIGVSPIDIVRDQIKSLLEYKPRFSTTNHMLSMKENDYCTAKMRMITCLLPYCTQGDIEDCSSEFIFAIINDFLFPELPDIEDSMFEEESIRWEGNARDAAISTLNVLCEHSTKNMYQLLKMWNKFQIAHRPYDPSYRPIIRGRQNDKVGLKNDGGTCYMNATIQQLVHVPGLAKELIAIQNIDPTIKCGDNTAALLCELQRVFAQLNFSRCQAVVPTGLWKEFRFEPDMPLNTKQHHDAIDFYSILLDKCDNILKKLGKPPLFQNRFFGKYSYEKICYGCWHRYKSPDEEFNCVSLALSGDNLEEALENFLAAHVMEGENAYHCEKCNEKKTTLNRSSFLELPSTMTIQLKRFTYDLVNNMIKKDNQFFKFPFEIDMTPYMATSRHVPDDQVQDLFEEMLWGNSGNEEPTTPPHGSEKPTGSASNPSMESPQKKMFRRHRSSTMRLSQSYSNTAGLDTDAPQQKPLIYELVGVLAHSGIATAGHYYSFIKERREEYKDSPIYGHWQHVNDMLISPMPMNTIEDVWFGGNFTQEGAYIGLDERVRHWNAYVLFYEKKQDDSNMLIPRHIIDNQKEPKPKVTFDVTDQQMDNGEDEKKRKAEEAKRTLEEARRLRVTMFHSLDVKLKKFLNNEHSKFLEDRDFVSFDLYMIYINSLLPMIRRRDILDFSGLKMTETEFLRMAFEYISPYIIRVAWVMFDDHRPKSFPRTATDLIKGLLNGHPGNKHFFLTVLEANNGEMMNRMLDATEHDIRYSFWQCFKLAMRLLIIESGRKEMEREEIEEPQKPDTPELNDFEEDEEEEELDEEDEEMEDEDSEGDDMMLQEDIQSTRSVNQMVSQLVNQGRNNNPLKAFIPVDLTKTRNSKMNFNSAAASKKLMPSNVNFQLNIIRKIVNVLPFRFRVHRTEGSSRHCSRHPIEVLYMISRLNEYGKSLLYLCNTYQVICDFLFEDSATVFARLRFTEDRLKCLGLWPCLPGLYFELLLDVLDRNCANPIDVTNYHMPMFSHCGKFTNEIMYMYCVSREEYETSDTKLVNDEKSLHMRIVMCYTRQCDQILKSSQPENAKEYIFTFTQSLLRENFSDNCYPMLNIDQWCHMIEFYNELAHRLIAMNMPRLAVSAFRNLLYVGVADDDDAVMPGLLPIMERWRVGEKPDNHKYRKMKEAMFPIRRLKTPELQNFLKRCHKRFRSVFPFVNYEEETNSDETMEDEATEDVMIGPQPLKRAQNLVDLMKPKEPTATASVTETTAINLEEHLKKIISSSEHQLSPELDCSSDSEMTKVEELSDEGGEEDVSMMALSDEPSGEEEKKEE